MEENNNYKNMEISNKKKIYTKESCESDKSLEERFEFRNIFPGEADQAVAIEKICFPPNEACSEKMMRERVAGLADLFLVAVDRGTGKIAGFLNGLSTDEPAFRDEFFVDASLYDPDGKILCCWGSMCCRSTVCRDLQGRLFQDIFAGKQKGAEKCFF